MVIQHHTRRFLALKRLEQEHLVNFNSESLMEEFNSETIPEDDLELTENTGITSQSLPMPSSFSFAEDTEHRVLSGFVSSTARSWFDPLETNTNVFTQQSFSALYNKQMTFNDLTRGNVSPLSLLMCNFSQRKMRPQVCTTDKQVFTTQTVNRSSAIISRRDIEKVTFVYLSLLGHSIACEQAPLGRYWVPYLV